MQYLGGLLRLLLTHLANFLLLDRVNLVVWILGPSFAASNTHDEDVNIPIEPLFQWNNVIDIDGG